MTELYRLVYTSRNLLTGTEHARAAAVAEILATSQANNARVGVSGALLFNGGSFAQVLEGPRPVVERTFERIQRDPRHSDVNVLQCEPVAERGFPNWSMAFVGHSVKGRALWDEMASRTGFDLARIEGEDLFATLHAIVLAEEGLAAEDSFDMPAAPNVPSESTKAGGELDVVRLRAELQDAMPEERQSSAMGPAQGSTVAQMDESRTRSAAGKPVSEAAILRTALAEERDRTTELRRNLDEARIATALAEQRAEKLRHERDLWAGRAKVLAAALAQDLEHVQDLQQAKVRSVA
ncbi:BLUF domain-containing protein [Lichenifustis flavocetrariae]|uniref:BLUF domain-containing protein n=1 Tax=Lichenifustis flavocetrariae TaxID=2949735 RepID=A0AA42CL79_9HYPH|nr:BLUF domain-containing protein [Lichenifustis flavocetrariae]MCW6511313.1 BLUF domain-containing protein [Lichenifustis flavocetrariae]